MKHNKETAPSTEKEREDFWLDLGPASAYEGLDCCETARRDGDASPDGRAHGFAGAESPKGLVAPRVGRKALRWSLGMICRPSTGPEKSH